MNQDNNNDWNIAKKWQHYTEPARPSHSECQIVKNTIGPGMTVLLLGSTPEYRDILIEKDCSVLIVDNNKDNYHAMTMLMTRSPTQENFICESWLDIDWMAQKFDVILGDHVINLLPKEQWPHFLQSLKKLLNPNGKLIQRVITKPESYEKNVETLARDTAETEGELFFSRSLYDLMFMVNIMNKSPLQRIWKLLEHAANDDVINDVQLQFYRTLGFDKIKVSTYLSTTQYILDLLRQHFSDTSIKQGDIFYRDYTFYIVSNY
jgi:cyclopropane fatty-acyl-phospholipid synthase-like methyltransferase